MMEWKPNRVLGNRAIKSRPIKAPRILTGRRLRVFFTTLVGIAFFAIATLSGFADNREVTGLLPSPRPFTLNLYDARMAAAMLERVGLVQVEREGDSSRVVKVKEVRVVYTGEEASLPEPHRFRFDLELNGSPLDWNNTYIKYASKMLNMRALFTYRNQRPVPEGPYQF